MFSGVDPPEDKLNALKNNLKLMDQLIGDNKFLTGSNLTIADLSIVATTSILDFMEFDVSDYPNFKRWFSTLKSELQYFNEVNHFDKEEFQTNIEKMKAKMASLQQNKW